MPKRRTKGDGGLTQRHDHPTCPPREIVGYDEDDNPVYSRPDHRCRGRWVGTCDVRTPTGGSRRFYVYGPTQAVARQKLSKLTRARDDGTLSYDEGTTVETWMAQWLEARRRPPKPLKPQTWNGYAEKNRNWITPYLGNTRLTNLRPGQIEALYAELREQGKAESTVRHVHAILSASLKAAFRKGLIATSPMDRVTPPGTEKKKREQFTLAQARQVLTAAGDSARWWLALFYGMRQGEVLGLDWNHVDFDNHTLTIAETSQVDYEHRGMVQGAPKSEAGKRTLPMVGQIETRMRLLWEGAGRPETGPVFVGNKAGRRLMPKVDWIAWRALIDSATVVPYKPLPYIALHAARGTASSLMEAAGISDRLVAQILGHAQVKVTHGYQHADLERVRDELTRAEKLVAPPAPRSLPPGSAA